MRLIVITPEFPRKDESELITAMLEMGIDRVHLRHPGCSRSVLYNIISNIALDCRPRITIHDNFDLVADFPELGVNLNARNPVPPSSLHGLISRSCHSVSETLLPADYALLSPIFPSISKEGYRGDFSENELMSIPEGKVYALGGITAERIANLKRYPFIGAAFLGSVWTKDTNPATVKKNVATIVKFK